MPKAHSLDLGRGKWAKVASLLYRYLTYNYYADGHLVIMCKLCERRIVDEPRSGFELLSEVYWHFLSHHREVFLSASALCDATVW